MTLNAYLDTLPTVMTATLTKGALFWANDAIYEVIEVDNENRNRARRWGGKESTDVALVLGSSLGRTLPTLPQGKHIPAYRIREDLLINGRYASFVFPTEQLALDSANMDIKLCGESSGLYVRRLERHPGFEATNGMVILRRYYYTRTTVGMDTNLRELKTRLEDQLIPHIQGPMAWHLLPTWDDGPYDLTQTVRMKPIDLQDRLRAIEETSVNEDTIINLKRPWANPPSDLPT